MPTTAYLNGMAEQRNQGQQDELHQVAMANNVQQLKDQLAAEKERERALKERTEKVRTAAKLMGMSGAEVAAAGVGELEAMLEDRKAKDAERQRQIGKMMLERDLRAVNATGQAFEALNPAQVKFFMGNTGANTADAAKSTWEKMGQADRAMAFGVRDEKLISRLMSDDQATARAAALEQERQRKETEAAAERQMIGTTTDLPGGNKGVWTSKGQIQVLPKDKETYQREVYQGDFVKTPEGTVQEWNPKAEVYTPVKPDAVQVEQVWDAVKKDFVKRPVEKDRWAKVAMPDKREVFESLAEAEAAKLAKGTKILVKDEKTGKYRPGMVQ